MIVDASAILAYLMDEDDRDIYRDVLFDDGASFFISPLNWWEVEARVIRYDHPNVSKAFALFCDAIKLNKVPLDDEQTNIAVEAFRRFGRGRHKAKLNMGDCFAYALAKSRNDTLLFKGDDFIHTDVRSAL